MSHRHPVDELFRSRLAQYDAGAPLPLWDQIAMRQKRRRRIKRFGWMLGGAGLLVLSTLVFRLAQPPSSLPPTDVKAFPIHIQAAPAEAGATLSSGPHSSLSPQASSPAAPLSAQASSPLSHAAVARGAAQPQLNTGRPSDAAASTPSLYPSGNPATSPSYADSRVPAPSTASLTASVPATVHNGTPFAEPVYTTRAVPPVPPSPSETAEQGAPLPLTLHGWTVKSADETTNEVPTSTSDGIVPATTDEASSEDASLYRLSGPHLRASARALAPLPQVKPTSHLLVKPNWRPMSKPTACVSFRQRSWQWAVEGLAGTGLVQNGFTARQNEAQAYVALREATEKNRLAYTGQFRVVLASPSGFRFRAGLQYIRLNSRFEYENPEVLEIHIMPRIGPSGEIIGADTTYSPYVHNTANHYEWLNIPLLAGYEAQCGKFRLGFMAGPMLNLLFDAKGEFLSPDSGQPTFFGQEGEVQVRPAYRQRAGLSWYAAATAAFYLNGRYSLIAEGFLQRPHQSITTTDYVLRHQPWATGLQLGIRAKL